MAESLVARAKVLATYADGRLAVEILGSQGCSGCRCARIAAPGTRVSRLELVSPLPLTVGDEIEITIPAREVLRGALRLHGLPWIAVLVGGAGGHFTGLGDLGCLLGAGAGLAAALVFLSRTREGPARRALSTLELVRSA